jgi:nitroimidazol reductase NimA-like FMN-containing flavoprotein (pyridoxamine 5'-phosphate oxidase superfamily)
MANTLIQPVHNNEACEKILEGTHFGTLVMCHDNVPYAVPINHAWVDGKFYFHCAVRGRKIDLINQNPSVVYVISKYHGEPGEVQASCSCHGPWESLIAYGTARIVEDHEEKARIFRDYMAWYGSADFKMDDHARRDTSAIVMAVESMTARVELTRSDNEYWLWLPKE